MAETKFSRLNVPDHTQETIETVAQLRAEHHENATPLERTLDHVMAWIGGPFGMGTITIFLLAWIGLNLGIPAFGMSPLDPPPFSWLQITVTLLSLYLVIMILATQRREDLLAQRREMLILELALLSEQKVAKVIQLLEELRFDTPFLRNRIDQEAEALAQPSDPNSVLEVIKENTAGR
jgi:uncharacterized membrane protein